MKPTRVLLTAASTLFISQVMAGEAVFYITEDGASIRDVAVSVDGQKQLIGKTGFVSFDINSGTHSVELSKYGEWLGEFEFSTESVDQNAEIQIDVLGGEALEDVFVYTPGQEEVPALGQISGYLESEETGGAVAGASISLSGTDMAVVTDEDGYFSFELPRGSYDVSIAHPNYGQRDVSDVRVMANVNTGVNLTLGMSGNGVIEEVVAVGSYIPSTTTAQERDSSAVLDSIGSEQMARFGDSNAASALKRVAGVTIAGGKYVVARGLNERHTSIMLNGASLPSPDPSRRVVPLDIFPSSILDGIDVQKTATPDVYADSTGSIVKLTTKKFPTEFEGKFSASLGYTEGLTLEDRTVQQSEGLDFLGFGADGDRAIPASLESYDSDTASSSDRVAAAEAMSENLATESRTIMPDLSLELSMGNTLVDNDDLTFGYKASVKYSNTWSSQDRQDATNLLSGDSVVVDDSYDVARTSNDINLGFGLTLGAIIGNAEYASNTLLLRQTHSETTVKDGIGGDQDRLSLSYEMDWLERQFLFQQFTGDHYVPELLDSTLQWQISFSQASLDNPDRRSYSFQVPEGDDDYVLYWSTLDRSYNEMTDTNIDFGTNVESLLISEDSYELKAIYGFSVFSRERDADGTEFGYSSTSTTADGYEGNQNIQEIVNETVAAGDTYLLNNSSASSDYDATWNYMAYYLGAEFDQFDTFKANLGFRIEDSSIEVNTYSLGTGSAIKAKLDNNDVFLSLGGTAFITEDTQLRLAVYQTQNRPDFRELANAQYTDPETGDTIRGYDELVSADVMNYDVRGEWYFSETESVTLALFHKEFDNPIEKTLMTGGEVFSYRNGEDGTVSGVEMDFRKEMELMAASTFVSGNLSIMESEVTISGESRDMQGQPDMLANVQAGYDDFENGLEYTVVVNYQGESLYSATLAGSSSPEVIQEPRTEVDFNMNYDLGNDMTIKGSLKNLLDQEVELTQSGNVYRSYKKGREATIGLSMMF
ncbi:TonB-dependent receptor [Oceanobacter sp. 4_MG-2023]|uniref:TonB-dependent receptor n=1 Tax=Oceanobacter sp. 4_MG-2023 TaxID=3062623 RepID=UPI0027363582|nr:TonB-dependent receptor [Oceanobacter sp. 4_MG-2023]MDP2547870.1 carboxypeptidase regulatory-like domain-containing protein [Oceanobacter sp. 4_MG-2023]